MSTSRRVLWYLFRGVVLGVGFAPTIRALGLGDELTPVYDDN